jgi:hypothetical protein
LFWIFFLLKLVFLIIKGREGTDECPLSIISQQRVRHLQLLLFWVCSLRPHWKGNLFTKMLPNLNFVLFYFSFLSTLCAMAGHLLFVLTFELNNFFLKKIIFIIVFFFFPQHAIFAFLTLVKRWSHNCYYDFFCINRFYIFFVFSIYWHLQIWFDYIYLAKNNSRSCELSFLLIRWDTNILLC